jgi:surfactin synthase thioesterase subunit
MRFYSGFSLDNDAVLFEAYLSKSEYVVAGFSYGAIKAVEHALESSTRIDTVQLFSPAFFQNKPDKFKRLQMMGFKKDSQAYLDNFFRSCFLPAKVDERVDLMPGSAEELEELLYYDWSEQDLKALCDRGVNIEVYVGSEDKIIDAEAAKTFFLPYATTYMINNTGHTLQGE